MKLSKTDRVVAVAAEPAAGPGWSNTPLWVIVQDGNGQLRRECLQPDEQGDQIRLVYATAAALHALLVREVETVCRQSPPVELTAHQERKLVPSRFVTPAATLPARSRKRR